MHKKGKKRIILNVSGEIFETYDETLHRFPATLLGNRRKLKMHYCTTSNMYFFDRNRSCFEAILYFYQSHGTLHCPLGIAINIFEFECQYFEIPQRLINAMKRKEGIIFELDQDESKSKDLPFQVRMWNILDNPSSSQCAWIYGMFSLIIVWLSIITASLETMPRFRTNSNAWSITELILNVWFLTEVILRIVFSQSKLEFFKGKMNLVDIAAVIPYFLLLLVKTNMFYLTGIFKTLKFMRVVRLFRLSKHSRRLKVVGEILKSSMGNFRLLMLCLVMVIFIGGTFIYVIEESLLASNGDFTSIPASIWWSVQTITSVGYGDLIPLSFVGRVFACCYMLFGAVTISLPVLTIVSQFTMLYPKNVECDSYMKQYQGEDSGKNLRGESSQPFMRRSR